MSFECMAWAVKQDTKTTTSKLILLMLANYADEERKCFPSVEHIAKLCHCSSRSVLRHIKDLEKKGFIKIGKVKGKVNNVNQYIVGSDNMSHVTNTTIGYDKLSHNTNITKKRNILEKKRKNRNFLAG